jgi:hypothetical protein
MVNIAVTHFLIMLLPFVGWIVGIKARAPIIVFFSGALMIAVAAFFSSVLPIWLVLSFGVLGIIVMIGSVMAAW